MVKLQKNKAPLKFDVILFLIFLFPSFVVYASMMATNSHKDEEMVQDINKSYLQAIDTAIKIISQESTIDEQLEKNKDFYDVASPVYPKNGPVVRYSLSHRHEVDVNLVKDNDSNGWSSAYITLGVRGIQSNVKVTFNDGFIKEARISFVGVFEKEGAYLNDKDEKVSYKINVMRYIYMKNIIIDFELVGDKQNDKVYPFVFYNVHIYIDK